ncbi:MAG: hypothetical protein JNM70_03635 [Anaerolineae bacterium]|nr:hypothetical protein [Anaerolineae bacterium]
MTPYHTEFGWIEPRILSLAYEGAMNSPNFREATEERVRQADAAGVDYYVLVMDIRKAVVTILDVKLAKWSADLDPRMIHVCFIGRSMMAQVIASGLARLSRLPVEFFVKPEDALERARAVLKQRKMTH